MAQDDDTPERSASGVPIYRYNDDEEHPGFRVPEGESALEEITDHLEAFLGECAGVYHEVVSDLVHLDVLIFAPNGEHDYYTLVTSGMSDLPMSAPAGREDEAYTELFLHLPPDWILSGDAFQKNENYWPVHWLKFVARFPHDYRTWIGPGHTIPNGEEAAPLGPGTQLGCLMLLPSRLLPEEFETLEVSPDKVIHFYNLFCLYPEEMQLKLDKGSDPLLDKLVAADIGDVLDPQRKNVAKRGRFKLW